jgi:ribosome-associated protein
MAPVDDSAAAPGGQPPGEPPSTGSERRDVLRVTRGVVIPLDELAWRFTTSGGPGGQHANKNATRAEVRFDIESSPSLGPRQRARLLERLGPSVRVSAGEERSQSRNREAALRRLAARLAEGLRTERPRVPTRPTAGAKRRRLEDKRRQSVRKRERVVRDDGD